MLRILICVKDKSKRCPNKNHNLIRFTIDYLIKTNYIDKTTIITDSVFICNIANHYNIDIYKENSNEDSEFLSAYKYIKEHNEIDEIILLPVTQPSRNINLLKEVIDYDISNYDFITSKVKINDRSIFYLDEHDKFIVNSNNRKGCMCKDQFMIDGAIYRIKTSFLKNVINSLDSNECFWSGKFITIYNDSKFFDIDNSNEYIDFLRYYTKKPQLLLIANKPSTIKDINEYHKYTLLFDDIARVSRCTNYEKTGTNVSLLMLEANSCFYSIRNHWKNYLGEIYKNIKQLYITEWWYNLFKDKYKDTFINNEQFNNLIIFKKQWYIDFKQKYFNNTNPTTTINFLYYLLEIQNKYHITLSHIDFINRDIKLQKSIHSNSYKYKREFLLKHFYDKNLSFAPDIEL